MKTKLHKLTFNKQLKKHTPLCKPNTPGHAVTKFTKKVTCKHCRKILTENI